VQLGRNRLSSLPSAICQMTALTELYVRTDSGLCSRPLTHPPLLAWLESHPQSSSRGWPPSVLARVVGTFFWSSTSRAFLFDFCCRGCRWRTTHSSAFHPSWLTCKLLLLSMYVVTVERCSPFASRFLQLSGNQLCWLPVELDRLQARTYVYVRTSSIPLTGTAL
jgi:hypothetical protein